MAEPKPLKIVAFEASNFKKLRVVQIRPDGNVVQITGKNGQGKSSVLDAIWTALAGKAVAPPVPIRQGADKATIKLDFGELKITRQFTRQEDGDVTTKVIVENADGARFGKQQQMLDALYGELTLDPLEFARADAKAQFDMLRRFVPGVDFAEIARLNKADYEKRTDINRDAKRLRASASLIDLPKDCPTERRDEAALVDEMQRAGEHNASIEARKAKRQNAEDAIARMHRDLETLAEEHPRRLAAIERRYSETVADLERQIEALQARIVATNAAADEERTNVNDGYADDRRQIEQDAAELKRRLDEAGPLPEPIDTTALRDQIASARDHNELVAQAAERARLIQEATDLEAQSTALTDAMARRDQEKQAAIAAAKLPVDGLGFGDGIVTLAGVPFSQGSDAEQLRASIAIAMASKPRLRIIRVRDGSLLDEDSMRLLAEMADAEDYQVWIERVGSAGPVGFELEDGQIKQPAPVEEAAD